MRILSWIFLLAMGCDRPSRPATSPSPVRKKAFPRQAPSILGSWVVVDAQFDNTSHPHLTGVQWHFDGQFAYEDFGADFAHSPHDRREYQVHQDDNPPSLELQSYGGDLITMNSTSLKLTHDLLEFEEQGSRLTLKRTTKPKPVTSYELARLFRQRITKHPQPSEIDGVWKVKTVQRANRPERAVPDSSAVWLIIDRGRMRTHQKSDDPDREYALVPSKIFFEVDASKDPRQINRLVDTTDGIWGGVQYEVGIYRLKGDELELLAAFVGKRPKDFEDAHAYVSRMRLIRERTPLPELDR